jgi:hypothetical protein
MSFKKRPFNKIREVTTGHVVKYHRSSTSLHPVSDNTQQDKSILHEPVLHDHELQQEPPILHDPAEKEESQPSQQTTAQTSALIDAYFDTYSVKCGACSDDVGQVAFHIQCKDCGSSTQYCDRKCFFSCHASNLNPFHKPKKWDVSMSKFVFIYNNSIVVYYMYTIYM